MIFKSVGSLDGKTEKSFFLEQIQVYRRLVEVFCERHGIKPCGHDMVSDDVDGRSAGGMTAALADFAGEGRPNQGSGGSPEFVSELKAIGIITDEDELPELKSVLGKEYGRFAEAVEFVIAHRREIFEGEARPGEAGDLLGKLYNSRRRKIQEEAAKKHGPTLVDFFCGAGGLSLGFVQEGFQVMLANDVEDVCVQTYKYNHPELPSDRLVQGDIRKLVKHLGDYFANDAGEEIDVVTGGPPCQGFSEANRQRVIDDPRNELYKYFVKAVEIIGPKIVVMENVKGMQKVAGQVVEDYERLRIRKGGKVYSYKVKYEILNSQDFSVAQSRERLIYIAVRNDVTEEKGVRPEDIFERIKKSCEGHKDFILTDALRDIKPLEAPRIKNMNEVDSDTTGKKIDINAYAENDNEYLRLINGGRKIPYVLNHKARYLSDVNYEIYKRLSQGDDATDEKIKDIMPYAHRNHCFKDKYYKLIADRPCRTITAHLKMDCHSHIHPYQVRALTPREAARVQSFPDDYLFWGAYLKTYMQIGNAVPTVMARGIARVIKECLE